MLFAYKQKLYPKQKIKQILLKKNASGKWKDNENLNEGADLQSLIKNKITYLFKNSIVTISFLMHWVFVQNIYCTNLKFQPQFCSLLT